MAKSPCATLVWLEALLGPANSSIQNNLRPVTGVPTATEFGAATHKHPRDHGPATNSLRRWRNCLASRTVAAAAARRALAYPRAPRTFRPRRARPRRHRVAGARAISDRPES